MPALSTHPIYLCSPADLSILRSGVPLKLNRVGDARKVIKLPDWSARYWSPPLMIASGWLCIFILWLLYHLTSISDGFLSLEWDEGLSYGATWYIEMPSQQQMPCSISRAARWTAPLDGVKSQRTKWGKTQQAFASR